MVKPLYKEGKQRAVTLSFDDGKPQDKRLIETFNKYGLKATFNLNGGRCRNPQFMLETEEGRLWKGLDELREMYKGHEIASHSFSHKNYTEFDDDRCREEIEKDIDALYKAFGVKVRGFASPNGLRDKRIPRILKENGICYQRYTCRFPTDTPYALPEDFLEWQPNPHFSNYASEDGKRFLEDFFNCNDTLPLLYIWGHSYELEELNAAGHERWNGIDDRWEYLENLCEYLSNRDDVWYATNIEICDYITALRRARFDDTYIDNPTDIYLYFSVDGKVIAAPPHTRFGV